MAGGGDPERGPQLSRQQLGPGQRETDSANAEERVLLRRHRQRRQRLVGAGVERAHDQRPAGQHGRDLGQLLGLLVLAGQRRAIQKQELGAQQPDAFGAGVDGPAGVGGRSEVGEHLDPGAVGRDGGFVGPSLRRLVRRAIAFGTLRRRGDQRRVGVDGHRSGLAVEQQPRVVGDAQHGVAEPDHGRQPERASEDRGVGRGRAAGGDDPEHPVGIQAGRVGRGEFVGDHDRGGHAR